MPYAYSTVAEIDGQEYYDPCEDFFDENNSKPWSMVSLRNQAKYEFLNGGEINDYDVAHINVYDEDEGDVEMSNGLRVSCCGGVYDFEDYGAWREYFGETLGTSREDYKAIFSAEVLDCIPEAKLSYWIEYNYLGKGIEKYEEWLDIDGEQGRHNLTPDGRRTDDL
jgi:hypothetical protein